ncbi:MAG: hypothetical protein LBB94_08585 [Clostridiales bacterium]|jgi:hypothetical protein|nr:hypothetical protein [Clostridiales bacterium]
MDSKQSKRLKSGSAVMKAALTLAMLVIGGTFAWINLSQRTVSEWFGKGSVEGVEGNGATLHDDFCENGENKDIYIENWGGYPIYARVRLDEYMEMGEGAGLKGSGPNERNPLNKAVSLTNNDSNIDDASTWRPYDAGSSIRDYWQWIMGGQKYYFPAPDDLRGAIDSSGTEYIDANSAEDLGPFDINNVGAYTKLTPLAEVIDMQNWLALSDSQKIGDYWVVDSDGWVYWADVILPGQATGLLLDKVTLINKPNQDYYYGINVKANMATKYGKDAQGNPDSYQSFGLETNGGWTQNGQLLMETLVHSATVSSVKISADRPVVDHVIKAAPGETLTLTAYAAAGEGVPEIDWNVRNDSDFTFYTEDMNARITINDSAAAGGEYAVTAYAVSDSGVTDTVTVKIVTPEDYYPIVRGGDEADYYNYGANTFSLVSGGPVIIGGEDKTPGTGDDITELVVKVNGVVYYKDKNGLYYGKGRDLLSGTDDDTVVSICQPEDPSMPPAATPTSGPTDAGGDEKTPTPTPTGGDNGTPAPTPTGGNNDGTPTPTPTGGDGNGTPTPTLTPISGGNSTPTPTSRPTPVVEWTTVTYHPNGATNTTEDVVVDVIKGAQHIVKANNFTKKGWYFVYYTTTKYPNSNSFQFYFGDKKTINEPVDFWAQWAMAGGCPIVLDLDGKGVLTTSLENGVDFDYIGNGVKVKTAWVDPSCGLLVRDLNNNGQIDSGFELFGSNAVLKDGSIAANGFYVLKELDLDGDGVVDRDEAEAGNIQIWRDANISGGADPGELLTFKQAGVYSIGTGYIVISKVDVNDNIFEWRGSFTRTNGSKAPAIDIIFVTE